jgi:hypothetical protein
MKRPLYTALMIDAQTELDKWIESNLDQITHVSFYPKYNSWGGLTVWRVIIFFGSGTDLRNVYFQTPEEVIDFCESLGKPFSDY